ncbi:tetratricopeptide repeat protein [Hespellia stercorisuis]|nr:tetratricopeptide repeat protein [Hespellia stercorisuis]
MDLLGLLNISHKDIELLNFEEDDIRDFMLCNYPILNADILADVLKLSDGLPILVDLFLKGFKEKGVLDNNMQVRKYIRQITESLTEKELKIAQIIALLSITKANISTNLLNSVISDFNENDITILESNALIEFHPIKREIKMHDIFRDFINSYYIMQEQKYILKLYRFFKVNSTEYESAYYAILVEDISIKDLIIPTIEKAISSENFSFLLLFGEHIKNIFGFQSSIGNISNRTFCTILLGYLEGLIGVGDYPAAKEIIDRCALTIRGNNISIHLRLSLLIANLYHLQNQYQEAIASYEILLNEINSKVYGENCLKYEAKCLWGIAHSYRHEGLNYTLAEAYYREAITSAQVTNQRSIILKCRFELVTIYILQNNQIAAHFELKLIDKIFKDLPSDQYIVSAK